MLNKRFACILLAGTMLIAGCNVQTENSMTVPAQTMSDTPVVTAGDTEPVYTAVPYDHGFDPHLYIPLLANDVPQDYWDALYSLCDALRNGESTFECSSEEAYRWAINWATLNELFPVASQVIKGESNDGSIPFENGTGRIYYDIPIEEYAARQAEFEHEITGIINSTIESDDNDFEKSLKLYYYIESSYSYADFGEDGNDGSVYYTAMNKKGLCSQLSGLYAYLLLQAGVEAVNLGCFSETVSHAWTYIVIGGKGYHSDPTWGLMVPPDNEELALYYFLMDDERRGEYGFPVDNINAGLLPEYWEKDSAADFSATDDSLSFPGLSFLKEIDEADKTVIYNCNGYDLELKYG